MTWYTKLHFHSDGRMFLGKALHADPSCRVFNYNERHQIFKIEGVITNHMPKCKYCARDVMDESVTPTQGQESVIDIWSRALQFVRELNNSRSGNTVTLTARQFKEMLYLLERAVIYE